MEEAPRSHSQEGLEWSRDVALPFRVEPRVLSKCPTFPKSPFLSHPPVTVSLPCWGLGPCGSRDATMHACIHMHTLTCTCRILRGRTSPSDHVPSLGLGLGTHLVTCAPAVKLFSTAAYLHSLSHHPPLWSPEPDSNATPGPTISTPHHRGPITYDCSNTGCHVSQ